MSDARDQQEIRDLIDTWIRASAAGDLDRVLTLMAEDVVFLLPGQPPLRGRAAYATMARAAAGLFRMQGKPDVQEITVIGDYAFCWNFLTVTISPVSGAAPTTRAGDILSVFRRGPDGGWLLYRDANLLTALE